MRIFRNNSFVKNMIEKDKKILILFFSVFISIFVFSVIITFFIAENIDIFQLIGDAGYFSLTLTFCITGVLAFKYYKQSSIIPVKIILKWFTIIALVIATISMVTVFLVAIPVSDIPSNFGVLFGMIILLLVIMLFIVLLIILALFFAAFGMVGVLVALVRAIAPEVLLHVSRISASRASNRAKKKKIIKLGIMDSIIGWAFAIPDVLETKTLRINHGKTRNWFPWSNFYKAIFWQLLLGTVLIVYISLNPLYVKSGLDFQNLFNLASNITLFVPFIILPWFIFLRLDAKIKGQVKSYELYRGIVYRMYQTFFTLGTIIIILRLGLEKIDPKIILLTLPMYYIFFISIITLVSFIYFNFLENGLAWEVAKRYREIKD